MASEDTNSSNYQTPKFCPQCGTPVKKSTARFCTNCGRDFKSSGSDDDLVSTSNSGSSSSYTGVPSSPSPGQTPSTNQLGTSSSNSGMTGQTVAPAQLYSQEVTPQRKTHEMITPNDIRPVSTPLFNREELKLIGIFALMAYLGHLMRFFIMFNSFPNLFNLVVPIPLYVAVVFIIILIQKFFLRDKGVDTYIEANRFDFTRSVVMSSFFLTLLPPRFKINKEGTNVPEGLYIPERTQNGGMAYSEISRSKYIGAVVRPRMHLLANFFICIFAFVGVLFYFNTSNPDLQQVYRLVSMYIASFAFVELAPIYGRNNGRAGEYGRIRTFIIFFIALVLFMVPLLGQDFFVALQNLNQ